MAAREGGGIRQRMAARAAAAIFPAEPDDGVIDLDPPPPAPAQPQLEAPAARSQLVNYLLSQFFWGYITAPKVQQIALHAMRDMEGAGCRVPDDLKQLANMGSAGRYPGKVNREIHRKFNASRMLQPPSSYQMPLLRRVGARAATMTAAYIYLPHILFAHLFKHFNAEFKKFIAPSREKIRNFWQSQEGNPTLTGHPITGVAGYESTTIPLALHGDGVVMLGLGRKWAKSSDVFSWRSLLGDGGHTTQFQFILWSVWSQVVSTLFGQQTKRKFWKVKRDRSHR